jgi:hypothetical protein
VRDPSAGLLLPAGESPLKNGKNTSNSNKKKKGLSQKNRIKAAYILLATIIVLVSLLLLVIPHQRTDRGRLSGEKQYVREDAPRIDEEKPAEEKTTEEEKTAEEEKPAAELKPPPKYLYLVIDDVGYSIEQLDSFLEIPVPMTFAILPSLEHTESAYRRILASGNEVMLHQPIEPLGDQNPGPGALYVNMQPQDIQRTVMDNLSQLPEAVGMNNHMGSKGTADFTLMKSTLEQMRRMNPKLFFLDSRTTSESVAEKVADDLLLPNTRRHVFLDNESSMEAIEASMEAALKTADEQGYVVMIGHVWCEELAAALALWYAEIEERGYEFAYMSSHFSEEVAHAGSGS